jgi:hypothetical protein
MSQVTHCDELSLWGGRIQLVYSNDAANEVVIIGGAGFKTQAEMDGNWETIVEHQLADGEPWCMADYCMPNGDILKDKQVSALTCQQLMGKSFDELVTEGLAWNVAGKAVALARFSSRHQK